MKKYSSSLYANPSSWYKEGVMAKKAMNEAREKIAGYIHGHADEIVFTSGGTEANNIAISGTIESLFDKGIKYEDMHIVTSEIEHSSVLETFGKWQKKGVQVDYVKVNNDGIAMVLDLKNKIKPNTVLVSIMMVNNEIGTIQPIKEIAKIIRQARETSILPIVNSKVMAIEKQVSCYPLLHTDCAQAIFEDVNVEKLGIDMLTLDGSKVYGPRGIGALFVRRDTPIVPVTNGGGQENGMRSGTENLPAIMGLGKAFEILGDKRENEKARIESLRQYFIRGLIDMRRDITDNVRSEDALRSPHILNISIPYIDGEFLLFQLDAKGIACSTKSSCLKDENESYVLKAIGANSGSSIRFSLGRWTKKRQIKKVLKVIEYILWDHFEA